MPPGRIVVKQLETGTARIIPAAYRLKGPDIEVLRTKAEELKGNLQPLKEFVTLQLAEAVVLAVGTLLMISGNGEVPAEESRSARQDGFGCKPPEQPNRERSAASPATGRHRSRSRRAGRPAARTCA